MGQDRRGASRAGSDRGRSSADNDRLRRARVALAGTLLLLIGACGAVGTVKGLLLGESGSGANRHLTGFIGGVVADEPQAALVGREILRRGGNAADAALATGAALAVTLPSRASLDGGGACLAWSPDRGGVAVADLFLPGAASGAAGADRPASVPMLLRGLYALQDRLGVIRFDQLLGPAEALARRGFPISTLLANDLAAVAGPLAADPAARAVFTAPDGSALVADDTLIERDLAGTLEQIGTGGPGALTEGALARRFAAAASAAGGGLEAADLSVGVPALVQPLVIDDHGLRIAFTPPPEDGGIAAARAFALLRTDRDADTAAEGLAAAVAATARASGAAGADAGTALLRATAAGGVGLPPLPASTSFAVLDRHGGAVACALTEDNLFGTGRVAAGTGILLAAAPAASHPLPLLPSAIAYDPSEVAFRAVVTASGQNDAAAAVAEALANALRTRKPLSRSVTRDGRVNAIVCPDGLPGDSRSCGGATDDRGNGLALGNL